MRDTNYCCCADQENQSFCKLIGSIISRLRIFFIS